MKSYLAILFISSLVLLQVSLPSRARAELQETSAEQGWQWQLDVGLAASYGRGLFDGVLDDGGESDLDVLLSGGAYYGDFYIESNPTTRHPLTVGYALERTETHELNLVMESYFFTIEDDKPDELNKLTGIKRRSASLEAGIEYVGSFGKVDFRSRLLHDVLSQHGGTIASLEFARPFFTRHYFVLPSIGITYLSNNAVDYYFGVRADEVSEGRQTYTAGSALVGSVTLYIERPLNDAWSLVGFAGYSRFSSAIADSPIVQPRSDAYNIGLGVLWSF